MKLTGLLLLLSLAGTRANADIQNAWILEGTRSCTFDANVGRLPTRCVQYHRVIVHRLKGGQIWNEYRWMWKDGKVEVQYASRIGLLGVSEFTIGEIAYRNAGVRSTRRARLCLTRRAAERSS